MSKLTLIIATTFFVGGGMLLAFTTRDWLAPLAIAMMLIGFDMKVNSGANQ